jgi:hypothetical protein
VNGHVKAGRGAILPRVDIRLRWMTLVQLQAKCQLQAMRWTTCLVTKP